MRCATLGFVMARRLSVRALTPGRAIESAFGKREVHGASFATKTLLLRDGSPLLHLLDGFDAE